MREGRAPPLPDYFYIIQEARYWRVSPMEIMEWPAHWIHRGQNVRTAIERAREAYQNNRGR